MPLSCCTAQFHSSKGVQYNCLYLQKHVRKIQEKLIRTSQMTGNLIDRVTPTAYRYLLQTENVLSLVTLGLWLPDMLWLMLHQQTRIRGWVVCFSSYMKQKTRILTTLCRWNVFSRPDFRHPTTPPPWGDWKQKICFHSPPPTWFQTALP